MQAEGQRLLPVGLDVESAEAALLAIGRARHTGAWTLRSAKESAEVHFVEGEVVDVVHGRHEGLKALARIVATRDGTHRFTPGPGTVARRLRGHTADLVEEALSLAVRAANLRARASDLALATFLTVEPCPRDASATERHVAEFLRAPGTFLTLLEALPHPDGDLLEAALGLHARGILRNLGHVDQHVRLCGPSQLHLVRASAVRARALGFAGPARLVFAATPARMAAFAHTVLSLSEARPDAEPPPAQPLPFTVATLSLGEDVELEIVGVPLVPAYAPLWPLALAGAVTVVKLDEGSARELDDTCASAGVSILDARAIFGVLEETSPAQVASLIKTALDAEGTSVR